MRTLPEVLAHDTVASRATNSAQLTAYRAEFLALADEGQSQLRPEGFLELHFAAEIFRDTWRLNLMAALDESRYSAETNDSRSKYRDRLNSSLRRNIMELRRLQTDRHLNNRWNLNLLAPASARDVLRFEKTNPARTPLQPPNPVSTRKSRPRNVGNWPNSPRGQSRSPATHPVSESQEKNTNAAAE